MGSAIILTRNHPSEFSQSARIEAYLITLQTGASGTQSVVEQRVWWNEFEQKTRFLATTFKSETGLPFAETQRIYFEQITKRFMEGFVHAQLYSFEEGKFVYHESRKAAERRPIRTRIEKLRRWVKRPT